MSKLSFLHHFSAFRLNEGGDDLQSNVVIKFKPNETNNGEESLSCVSDFASCNSKCLSVYGFDQQKQEECQMAVSEFFFEGPGKSAYTNMLGQFVKPQCFSGDEWVGEGVRHCRSVFRETSGY